jgi:pimeloyl-ACP methyl ester carboxylesterase
MPFLERPSSSGTGTTPTKIYYEVKGTGDIFIFLLAPGGMRSSIPKWDNMPYNPWTSLSTTKFTLIGMDQRFSSSRSSAEVQETDGWDTFVADQIALLDYLKIEKCHVLGSCIGPSYAFKLLLQYPHRFGKCVMMQPIGLACHTSEPVDTWQGLNTDTTWTWFGDWAQERLQATKNNPKKETLETLKRFHDRMFQDDGREFVFSITRDQAKLIQTPLLVLMGNNISHPAETSREICQLCPSAELITEWRDVGPEKLVHAAQTMEEFLSSKP